MQNALYFENSHVRPVPLLIGVKKKFLQRIISKKKKIPFRDSSKSSLSICAFTLSPLGKFIQSFIGIFRLF